MMKSGQSAGYAARQSDAAEVTTSSQTIANAMLAAGCCRTKRCPICREEKSLTDYDFYFDKKRNKQRIQSRCKTCKKQKRQEQGKELYLRYKHKRKQYNEKYKSDLNNKEKLRLQSKKYRADLPDSYVAVYLSKTTSLTVAEAKQDKELIEAQRAKLKLVRKIREIKNEK